MNLASVLCFTFGHYSSLIGIGCKLFGTGNQRYKNTALMLMVPILAFLGGLHSYGVDSEVLMVAVLPQCLCVWVSVVWWWIGVCIQRDIDNYS